MKTKTADTSDICMREYGISIKCKFCWCIGCC